MTSSDLTEIVFWKEDAYSTPSNYGKLPAVTATPTILRKVSENLAVKKSYGSSNETRADGQTSDVVVTDAEGNGSLNIQFSYGTYDDWLAALVRSTWSSVANKIVADATKTLAFTSATRTIAVTGSYNQAPSVGDFVLISGFGNDDLDRIHKCDTGTSGTSIILEDDGTDWAAIGDKAGATGRTIGRGEKLENGTTPSGFGCERWYTERATDNVRFLGVMPLSLQLSGAPGQAGLSGSFGVSVRYEQNQTSRYNSGTANAATTTRLFNSMANVVKVRTKFGATNKQLDPLGLNLNLVNGTEGVSTMRKLGAQFLKNGSYEFTVGLEAVYDGPTYAAALLADTEGLLEIGMIDADRNGYLIRMPRIVLSEVTRPNSGRNTLVQSTVNASAISGAAKMIEIYRIPKVA